MWDFVKASFLAILPRRWRLAVPGADTMPWERGGALSGFLEALVAAGLLVYWYSLSVTTWAANGLDSALRGGPERNVPGQAIGFAALVLWALHPLTWFIAYFLVEGTVRIVGAAFTGHVMGTLPLFVVDWVYGKFTHRPPEGDALHLPGSRASAASFLSTVKDLWVVNRLPLMDDAIAQRREGTEEHLEVTACRPKPDWVPPRIVRIDNAYYRLEETYRGSAPRPFVYQLRRLPAGVPGRNVLQYRFPSSPKS